MATTDLSTQGQVISVFSAKGADGNPARVFLLGEPPLDSLANALSALDPRTVNCLVWPVKSLQNNHLDSIFHVACYRGAQRITCCGHGLLASAHALSMSHQQPTTLISCGGEAIDCQRRGRNLWLRFPRLACHPVPVTTALAQAFDTPPVSAALCGDNQGYCILEWPPGTALEQLTPRLDQIAAATTRAVIVTARWNKATVQLRYFAPQYGTPEDTVTGSACRVLGDYWQRRGLARFRALQRSRSGGVVQVEADDHSVAISGRVRRLPLAA